MDMFIWISILCSLFSNRWKDILLAFTAGTMVSAATYALIPATLKISNGVSFASYDEQLGMLVAYSIGLQNIPEGFIIALVLYAHGASRLKAVLISFITGLMEFAFILIGYSLTHQVSSLIPYGLSVAAGAILYCLSRNDP